MTGWLIGSGCVLAIVGGPLAARWAGWRLHGWRLRRVHAQHAAPAEVVEQFPDQDFYGTMVPERGLTEREQVRRAQQASWLGQLPAFQDPPTAFLPAPTEAEVAASRAAHGYIPELDTDPGPGSLDSLAPGPVPAAVWSRAAPRAASAGIDQSEPRSPGNENRDRDTLGLGPRAAAVLERYEQRRQERWALA